MSSFIFPLITFPYISRVLLAEGNGKVQFATSVVSYFILLAQLGIPTYGVRACAAVRDDRRKLSKTVHELFIINAVMTVVSYAAFFAILLSVPRLHNERMLYIITSAGILLNLFGMEWLFRAVEQYRYITIRSLAFKVISVAAMFLLVHQQSDYLIYAAISVVASLGSNVLNLTQLHKHIDCRYIGDYHFKQHIRPILIFFAMSCTITIYTSLDSAMLGFMATDADVGYYAAGVKIKNILVSITAALGTVILPRAAYYFENKRLEEFWRIVTKALRFVMLVSIPLMVYFMLFAENGVYLL
jgi:O-antigen/teichoic acid export membrane protein